MILRKTSNLGSILLIFICSQSIAHAQGIDLDKNHFSPGEEIVLHFTSSADFANNAWIGIIPSDVEHGSEVVNDQHDLAYQYLNKKTSGTLTFKAPSKAGVYDFRMHDTDTNGREITSVSFTVAIPLTSSLHLDKIVFFSEEEIKVQFTTPDDFASNAWVGIIPSNIQHGSEAVNDQHDLVYQYLNKRTSGTLTFKAPAKEGSFDFRMHNTDNNGREVTSVSFKVANIGIPEIGFAGKVAVVQPPTPDRVIVYLVAGQSNADGYGVTGELSSDLQAPQPDIDFYHGNAGGNSPLAADQWIHLQPGSGSKPGNAGGFGPELSFGIDVNKSLGSEGARIAVIKHALGGSNLHTQWIPGGDATTAGDGPAYQAFQSTVSSGLAALSVLYPNADIQIEGIIWHQGEADTESTTTANAYESRLAAFIEDVRATFGPALKFGVVQLSDNQTALDTTGRAVVKAAQAAVAERDPLNYLVITDDIPTSGSIHFGTTGMLEIGSRLAAGMRTVPITDADGNGLDENSEEL